MQIDTLSAFVVNDNSNMVKWAQIYCQLKSTGMTVAMYSVTLTRHVTLTITQDCVKNKTVKTGCTSFSDQGLKIPWSAF